ncbi:MAG: transferrin-binding protein-like solute binding protein [Burkholderiaceae bacterium]|nr:transferrin-binding protein-like solute binding protein [Burkholderiaceae bacterium]
MSRERLISGFRRLGAFGAVALALALALAGCGGGNAGGVLPGGGVIGDCPSLSGGGTGYSLGICRTPTANGTVLESQLQPTTPAVTIAPDASQYKLDFGAPLGSQMFITASDQTNINTLGEVKGVYLQKDDPVVVGAYAAIGDFADARERATNASLWGAAGGLSYTSFGLWERFVSASEGYYGGWYMPRTPADAIVSMPNSGSATYTGIAVGALAPVQGFPPSYGVSASLSLTASFSDNNVAGSMSNFQLSNVALPEGLPIPWKIAGVPLTVSLTGQIAAGTSTFTGSMDGDGKGTFEGAFFGAQPAGKTGPAEIGGRFQFVTPDARQVVGAFGGRQ